MTHDITIKPRPAVCGERRWRAECSCGWHGPLAASRSAASAKGTDHMLVVSQTEGA